MISTSNHLNNTDGNLFYLIDNANPNQNDEGHKLEGNQNLETNTNDNTSIDHKIDKIVKNLPTINNVYTKIKANDNTQLSDRIKIPIRI